MKASELTGRALDWAVAMAEGATDLAYDGVACYWFTLNGVDRVLSRGWSDKQNWHPSTNWAQAGAIIEREGICVSPSAAGLVCWVADMPLKPTSFADKTRCNGGPLVAAMRCYVASKLGEEINIPENLK